MSNDRMDVILHYQEMRKVLQDLVMAASPYARNMSNEELLKQPILQTFEYLRWHCDRCGSRLEAQDGAPVAGSMGGPQLASMCMPCYNEMNGWARPPE